MKRDFYVFLCCSHLWGTCISLGPDIHFFFLIEVSGSCIAFFLFQRSIYFSEIHRLECDFLGRKSQF